MKWGLYQEVLGARSLGKFFKINTSEMAENAPKFR